MRMRRIPAMLTALVLIAGQGAVLAGDTVYAAQNPVYAVTPAGSAGEEIGGVPLPSEMAPGDEAVSPAGEEEPGEGDGILPEDPATGEDGSDITADPAGEDPEAGDPADGEGEDTEAEDGEALLPEEGDETADPADVLTPVENGPEEILGGYSVLNITRELDFGTAPVGYTAAQRPAAQIVTVKNIDDDTVTLELPAVTNAALADRWEISKPAKLELQKNEMTSFTVRPKIGIVSTMNGDQTENAAFDLTVKTADGVYEETCCLRFLVGLTGNIPARSLAAAYGAEDTAILTGNTKLTLTAGEYLVIGDIRPEAGADPAPALTVSGAGTMQTRRIDIEAGELMIDAGAKLACTSGIRAGNIRVSKNCELTAAMTDEPADGESGATVECGSFISHGTVQITAGDFIRDGILPRGILADNIEIPEGSFTVKNPSGNAFGPPAIEFRKSMKIGTAGSGAIPTVSAHSANGYAIYGASASDQEGLIVSGKARILAETETVLSAIFIASAPSEATKLRLGIDDDGENRLTDPIPDDVGKGRVEFSEAHGGWVVFARAYPANRVLVEPKSDDETQARASVSVSAESLRFTGVEGEAAPAAKTIVIRNTGDVPLCLNPDQVVMKQNPSNYRFTQTGRYFLPGETVTLTVSLNNGTIPQADSGPYTAELQINRIEIPPSRGFLATGEPAGITKDPYQALQIVIPIDFEVTPAFSVTPSADAQNGGAVDLGETMVGQTLEPVTFMIRNNGTVSRNFLVRVYKSNEYTPHESLLADKDPGEAIEVKAGARLAVAVSSGKLTAAGEMTGRLQITANGISREIPLKAAAIEAPTGLAIKAIPDQYYDGTAKKPVPQVWFGNTRLEDTDYTVTYANNTNAATKDSNKPPTVTVRGKGNFAGSCSASFNIRPRPVADAEAENDALVRNGSLPANQILTANGRVQKGKFVLKYPCEDGRELTLKENTDYTLDYQGIDPKEAGLYTVTVIGKGNYTGSRTVTLAIVDPREKTLISKTTIPAIPNQVYSGKDYILRAAGAVCGAEQTFALDASKKQYSFTIKKGSQVLRYGRDYTLTYADNREVGTATVTIIGTGDAYTGSVTKTFKITGKPLASVKQTGFITKVFYTGSPVSQPLVFHDTAREVDRDLEVGRDYTVTCEEGDAKDPGTYHFVYTGMGLYTGSVKKTFTIVSDIRLCSVEGLKQTYEWTGLGINPMTDDARLVIGERTLRPNIDYTSTTINNERPGTATITITGKAPYTGTVKKTFRIVPCSLNSSQILIKTPGDPDDFNGAYYLASWSRDPDRPNDWYSTVYSKSGAKPVPTIMDTYNFRILVPGTDYTLQWSNCTAAYTGDDPKKPKPTVTVIGKGMYSGRITLHYFIEPAPIDRKVGILVSDVYYKDRPGFFCNPAMKLTDERDGKALRANVDYRIEGYKKYVPWGDLPNNFTTVPLSDTDKPEPGTRIQVTVTGIGNYRGSDSVNYYVVGYNIASADIKIDDQTYNDGRRIKPGAEAFHVTATIGGSKVVLEYGEHYVVDDLSWENNTMPGTARVMIYGISQNGYGGSKVVTFQIKKREPVGDSVVIFDPTGWEKWTEDLELKVPYSPAGCRPQPYEVCYKKPNGDEVHLNPDTDYTLSWRNNTVCATANGSARDPIVTITFKGNYTGKVERHFSIDKRELNHFEFHLATSQNLEPYMEKDDKGVERMTGLIYKRSGMREELIENASGRKVSHSDYQVTYQYDLEFAVPEAKIRRRDKNGKLVEVAIDFFNQTIMDGDIIPAGTMLRVIVKAAEESSRYFGVCDFTDNIMACADIGKATIIPPVLEYEPHPALEEGGWAAESCITAPEKEFVVKARVGSRTITLDPDCYGLAYWENNHHAGTAQVTVIGMLSRGFGGSKIVNVKINPLSFSKLVEKDNPDIRMTWTDEKGGEWDYWDVYDGRGQVLRYEYSPNGVTPRPEHYAGILVTDDETFCEAVDEGEDYTISYRNNKKSYVFEAGSKSEDDLKELKKNAPAVIFTGKGDYCGSCELYFSIKPSDMAVRCDATASDVIRQEKAGNYRLRDTDVRVTDRRGVTLKAGTDYCKADGFVYKNRSGKSVYVTRPGEAGPVEIPDGQEFGPQDNVPAGTKIRVSIKGMGNYEGSATADYMLLSANTLNAATVRIPDKAYTGGEIDLTRDDITISMRVGGKLMELKSGEHYRITGYEGDHTAVGTAKVRIEGIPEGGFKGSRTVPFKIKAYSME